MNRRQLIARLLAGAATLALPSAPARKLLGDGSQAKVYEAEYFHVFEGDRSFTLSVAYAVYDGAGRVLGRWREVP